MEDPPWLPLLGALGVMSSEDGKTGGDLEVKKSASHTLQNLSFAI